VPIFQSQTTLGASFSAFLGSSPRISGICEHFHKFCSDFNGFSWTLPGFSTNQNFWRCSFTPCTTASGTRTSFCFGAMDRKFGSVFLPSVVHGFAPVIPDVKSGNIL